MRKWLFVFMLAPALGMAATHTISSLPYTFSATDMTLGAEVDTLVLAGTALYSDHGGIELASTTSLTLDGVVVYLVNDSIIFGQDGGDDYRGINITGERDRRPTNISVIGGYIANDPPEPDSVRSVRGISMAARNVTIDGTTIMVQGWNKGSGDIQGVYLNGVNTYLVDVKNCHIQAIAKGFHRRDNYLVCAVKMTDVRSIANAEMQYTGTYADFYHLNVEACSLWSNHVGVSLYGRRADTEGDVENWHKSRIYNNYIMVDARNDNYLEEPHDPIFSEVPSYHRGIGNAYGIASVYSSGGSVFRKNTIRSGTDHRGGEGMMFVTNRNYTNDTIYVDSNDIDVHQGPDHHYGLSHRCQGINIRQNELSNYMLRRNAVIVTGDNDTATYHTGHNVVAFRNSQYGTTVQNNWWIENTFTAIGEPAAPESGGEGTEAICIAFDGQHVGVADPELTTLGNVFQSNNRIIQYGYLNAGSDSTVLTSDTMRFTGTTFDPVTFALGWPNSTQTNHHVVDPVFQNGASPSDIQDFTYNSSDLTIHRTLRIFAQGSNSLPVVGATISVANAIGQQQFSGTTSNNGLVQGRAVLASGNEDGLVYAPADLNPFRVEIISPDESDTTVNLGFYVGFNSADSANDTLTLSETVGTGSWGNASPVISGLIPSGQSYTEGETVEASADFTDNSGLASAFLWLIKPGGTDSSLIDGTVFLTSQPTSYTASGEYVIDFTGDFRMRAHATDIDDDASVQTSAPNSVQQAQTNATPSIDSIAPSNQLLTALSAFAYRYEFSDAEGLDSAVGFVRRNSDDSVLDTLFATSLSGGSAVVSGNYTPDAGDTGTVWFIGWVQDDSSTTYIDSSSQTSFIQGSNPTAVNLRGDVTLRGSAILRTDRSTDPETDPSE